MNEPDSVWSLDRVRDEFYERYSRVPWERQLLPTAPDRGGNALALPIIFSFMLVAFCAGFAVGWWAWS